MSRKARVAAARSAHKPAERQGAPSTLEDAVDALAQQARQLERMRLLVEASKAINSTLDLAELLQVILDFTTEQTGAERATLFLIDAQRRELWSLYAEGLDQREIRVPMGHGIAGYVAGHGHAVNLANARADQRFDPQYDQVLGYETHSLLAAPVKDREGRTVGVLELLNKRGGRFTAADIEFLDGISVHAAIALENARLHRESVEHQRLERELALARSIQRGLLPDAPPVLEGFDVAVRHETTRSVGGDYYDFMPLGPSTHLFVVADVEGRGVSSAIIMSNLQATLHALVLHVHPLEGILYALNENLRTCTRGQKYVTLFLGLLDLTRRNLHYINAGHVPPLLLRANGEPLRLEEGGTVLGLLPGMRYKRGILPLNPGDLLLACTDGITEAADGSDEQYGAERVARAAGALRAASASAVVDAVFAEVAEFSGAGSRDDKVLMVLKAL